MGKDCRILVAGDIMLDSYCIGYVKRISPEAPVPIFNKKDINFRNVAGGVGNVAVNLKATDVDVDLLSTIGADKEGNILLDILNNAGINTEHIIEDATRPTTTKLRYLGQNNQQVLRVDYEDTIELSEKTVEGIVNRIYENIDRYNAILLSDYKKGFLTKKLCQSLIKVARDVSIPVIVDVKDSDYEKYMNATVLKPNQYELALLTGCSVNNVDDAVIASDVLIKRTKCKYVLTTLGADGMLLTDSKEMIKHINSFAKEVFDVTGAGDTVAAYFTSELAKGRNIVQAMEVANYAASVQVSKVGTSVVDPMEVRNAMHMDLSEKDSLSVYDMERIVKKERNQGKKIVFTNGCFDIIHPGHVQYLTEAKQMGDILIVGINTDASVKRLKGSARPINTLEERKSVLKGLKAVDYVISFDEDTPINLIRTIKPDVLVKGGDYTRESIVGADFVESYGGQVAVVSFIEGKSTTNIIKKMQMEEMKS